MFSIHDVKNILTIRVFWCESSPKKWKIQSINDQKSTSKKYDDKNYPLELKETINNFDTFLKGFMDGIIQTVPDDLIDFKSQKLTDKQESVLKTLMTEVPRGSVITYKNLGIKSGVGPNASRFVGNTMHLNYWPIIIPCHRVVKSDYSLGNYSMNGPSMKEKLLIEEGISIKNHICKMPTEIVE
ncbi:Methylated-DNA--protein-cysteine methyltransferase [Tritrichomonas foetus]|uniref:Methylated-DNA--protein-cysteine methyltransferase n=1 Tax=Tritrichomonas foetus TaxID=1144522 RepID=A0A1J4JFT8_9EUKA|nr:Methylated-DNA--protein-cysteine methyltransferase [Tritrichomonas foetus]|eukprot:OHS97521.1 Methylated-DNA--protein-cysteine methyltransferase [Tritrichomonas foetus]